MSNAEPTTKRTATCAACGDEAVFNEDGGGPRSGKMLCGACARDDVRYVTECLDCEWSYEAETLRSQWYHAQTRVQQEGNNHETEQRTFADERHETVWRVVSR